MTKRGRMDSVDPMAVVTRFIDAANHHDVDALRACVHREFESVQPIHPGRNFRGPGQLVSNWRAIFEAEPGFRLSVRRASVTDDTVWVEVHGAGASAEAAGIFIVGIEDGRIRWIRVYSDLVEPVPETEPQPELEAVGQDEAPATTEEGGGEGDDGPAPALTPVPPSAQAEPETETETAEPEPETEPEPAEPDDDAADDDGTGDVTVSMWAEALDSTDAAPVADAPEATAGGAVGGNETLVPTPETPDEPAAEDLWTTAARAAIEPTPPGEEKHSWRRWRRGRD